MSASKEIPPRGSYRFVLRTVRPFDPTIERLASTYSGGGSRHARPSYSVLRTAQKLYAGALACAYTGENASWFNDGTGPDNCALVKALVASARGG